MNSIVDSLFDQYDRGRMTRRNLVQALAALAPSTSTPAQDGVLGFGSNPARLVRQPHSC